jgi:hypothetical protein
LTTALQCLNTQKPYTLAGFEPWILCFGGRRDDHFATPPGPLGAVLTTDLVRFFSDINFLNTKVFKKGIKENVN